MEVKIKFQFEDLLRFHGIESALPLDFFIEIKFDCYKLQKASTEIQCHFTDMNSPYIANLLLQISGLSSQSVYRNYSILSNSDHGECKDFVNINLLSYKS